MLVTPRDQGFSLLPYPDFLLSFQILLFLKGFSEDQRNKLAIAAGIILANGKFSKLFFHALSTIMNVHLKSWENAQLTIHSGPSVIWSKCIWGVILLLSKMRQGSCINSHLAILWLLLKNNVKDGLYSFRHGFTYSTLKPTQWKPC